MAFDIQTRSDRVNRRTLPVSSGTYITGRWCSVDANGYAAAANAGSMNNYIIILGNEVRPDSIGSSSITVAYGQNLFMLDTYGLACTTTAGMLLTPDSSGDLVACNTPGLGVAFAENVKGQGATGLKIRTLI
jgi:hypothetical protein